MLACFYAAGGTTHHLQWSPGRGATRGSLKRPGYSQGIKWIFRLASFDLGDSRLPVLGQAHGADLLMLDAAGPSLLRGLVIEGALLGIGAVVESVPAVRR